MENLEAAQNPPAVVSPVQPSSKRNWVLLIGIALFAILIVAAGFEGWLIYKLRKDVSSLQWGEAIHERDDDSVITTDVGSIQFLKKGGYSITLDTAKYMADGLYLHGQFGNATNVTLSGLSLKFTATKQLYEYQDEFDKNSFIMFLGPPSIGEAQTTPISYVGTGKTEPFEVTIPNVKQTKEPVRLVVSFSGERYSYF